MAAPRPAAAGELDRSGAPAGADPALLAGGGAPAAGVAVAAEEADDLDDAGFEPQLATPAHLNVNRLSRLLRREDLSLRNCLLSIEADAEWVARAAAQLPPLPLVANLRSGRWYVPHPEAECYFKARARGKGVSAQRSRLCSRCARGEDEHCVTW